MRRSIVRIISRKKIREASEEHGEWEASLAAWYRIAKSAKWDHFGDVRKTWKRADNFGMCVVFDISHNRCRLIAYINYKSQKVFILHILTHIEYDKERWKDDCYRD